MIGLGAAFEARTRGRTVRDRSQLPIAATNSARASTTLDRHGWRSATAGTLTLPRGAKRARAVHDLVALRVHCRIRVTQLV